MLTAGPSRSVPEPIAWRTALPRCRMTLRSRWATAGQAEQTWSLAGIALVRPSTNAT